MVLTLLWALPAAAGLWLAVARGRPAWIAPAASAAAFLLALWAWASGTAAATSATWIAGVGGLARYALGGSGLSMVLAAVTLLITALAGAASMRYGGTFCAWLSLLGAAATGMFLARDLLLFYLFWELMLIPVYFLLVGWGGAGRRAAAWKFIIYNVAGSVLLLVAVAALIAFGVQMPAAGAPLASSARAVLHPVLGALPHAAIVPLALALFIAFAVKTPMWPVHGWVADTYAELPAPAAALVAGAQSKAGLYAMYAILLPLLPSGVAHFAGWFLAFGIVSVLYGALCSLSARDPRRLLAYSSISHLGLVMMALVTLQPTALAGGVIQMVAHALFTAGLFLLIGMLEARAAGPLELSHLGGLARRAPAMAGALMLLGMAALGLPGLAGFPGELLMLVGIWSYNPWLAVLAGVGLLVAAAYMLRFIQLTLHGAKAPAALADMPDLRGVERWLLAPLGIAVLLIGLWPQPIPQRARLALKSVSFAVQADGAVSKR